MSEQIWLFSHTLQAYVSTVHSKIFSFLAAIEVPQIDTQKQHFFCRFAWSQWSTLGYLFTVFHWTNLHQNFTQWRYTGLVLLYHKSSQSSQSEQKWRQHGCCPDSIFLQSAHGFCTKFRNFFDRVPMHRFLQNSHRIQIWISSVHSKIFKPLCSKWTASWCFKNQHFFVTYPWFWSECPNAWACIHSLVLLSKWSCFKQSWHSSLLPLCVVPCESSAHWV